VHGQRRVLPFCNIYSAFSQRAYDHIIHDLAILNLPVVLCLDRAGLVGEDGPTHHGAFDLAALRAVPNITISSPMDEHELRRLMYTGQLEGKGMFVIRYPRGRGVLVDWHCPLEEVKVGTGRRLRQGRDVAVLSLGPLGNTVTKAIDEIEAEAREHHSLSSLLSAAPSVAHYDMRFVKPPTRASSTKWADSSSASSPSRTAPAGWHGLGGTRMMADHGYHPDVVRLGRPTSL
jgi:1-deoxy-D-xylulose-5-phosphate synthase